MSGRRGSSSSSAVERAVSALAALCDEDKHAHLLHSCTQASEQLRAAGESEASACAVVYLALLVARMAGDSRCALTTAALHVLRACLAGHVLDGTMCFHVPAQSPSPARRHGFFRAADATALQLDGADGTVAAGTSLVAVALDTLARLVARMEKVGLGSAPAVLACVERGAAEALHTCVELVVADEVGVHGDALVHCVALVCSCALLTSRVLRAQPGKAPRGEASALCSRMLVTLLRRAHVIATACIARARSTRDDGGHLLDDMWDEVRTDCVTVVRFLCGDKTLKIDGATGDAGGVLLRLSLLRLVLARMPDALRDDETMQHVVLHVIVPLLRRCLTHAGAVPTDYLAACLHVLLALMQHHAVVCDVVPHMLIDMLLPLLDTARSATHSDRISSEVQLVVLHFLARCLSSAQLVRQLYVEYDCNALRANMVKLVIMRLARMTSQMRGTHAAAERPVEQLTCAAYDALRAFLRSVRNLASKAAGATTRTSPHTASRELPASSGATPDGVDLAPKPSAMLTDVLTVDASEAEDIDIAAHATSVSGEQEAEDGLLLPDRAEEQSVVGAAEEDAADAHTAFALDVASSPLAHAKAGKERMMRLFNEEAAFAAALRVAEAEGLVRADDAASVARLLRRASGSVFDPVAVGAYLSKHAAFERAVLKAYVALHNVRGVALDEAVRHFLGTFRLCGEAEAVDATMELFAAHYHEANPDVFRSAGAAFVLAFSIVMLNTDAHSPQVKAKMTLDEFVRNNRGMNEGSDFPDDLLAGIYNRITAREIVVVGGGDCGRYATTMGVQLASPPQTSTATGSAADERPVDVSEVKVESRNLNEDDGVVGQKAASSTSGALQEGRTSEGTPCVSQTLSALGASAEGDTAGDAAIADVCSQAAVAPLLVRDMWYTLLPTLSFPLEETDDEAVVDACLESFSHMIYLCTRCRLHTVLTTFVSALFTFTHLTNPRSIAPKNVKAIALLLSVASQHGGAFGDCWQSVVRCVSLIDKLTSQAPEQPIPSAAARADRSGNNSSMSRRTGSNASLSIPAATGATPGVANESTPRVTPVASDKTATAALRSPSRANAEGGPTASRSADLVARHISLLDAERLFAQSPRRLPMTALLDMLRALCAVSRDELRESPARVYCVQHMVEVVQLNRTRLLQARHWPAVWDIVSRHVSDCIARDDVSVALFAINSVRHLSLVLLGDEAYGAASSVGSDVLQRNLLSLYTAIAERERSATVLELLVASLGQLMTSHGSQLCVSAWSLMLDALIRCAQREHTVGPAVLAVLDKVTSDHLPSLRTSRAAGCMCRLVQGYAAVAQGAKEQTVTAATQALAVLLARLAPAASHKNRRDGDCDAPVALAAWQMCFATLADLAVMTERGAVAEAAIGVLVSDGLGLVTAWPPCTTFLFARCFIGVLDVLVVRCAARPKIAAHKLASTPATVSSHSTSQRPDTVTSLLTLLRAYVEGLTTGAPLVFLAEPVTISVEEDEAGPRCLSVLFHALLRYLTSAESEQVQEVCAEGVHRLLCAVADARTRPSMTSEETAAAHDDTVVSHHKRGGLWVSFCNSVLVVMQEQMGMLHQLCSRPCLAVVARRLRASRVSLAGTIALARLTQCMFYESCNAVTTLAMQCLQGVFDSAAELVANAALTRATTVTANAAAPPYRWLVVLLTSLQLAVSEVFVDVYVQLCVDTEQHPQLSSATVAVQRACDKFMSRALQVYTRVKDDAMLTPPTSLAGQQGLRVARTVMHAQLSSVVQVTAGELHRRMRLFMSELCTFIRYADDELAPLLSDLFLRFWSTETQS